MARTKKDVASPVVTDEQSDVLPVKKSKKPSISKKKKVASRGVKTKSPTQSVRLSVGDTEPNEPQAVPIQTNTVSTATPYTERFALALFKPPLKPSIRYDYMLAQIARVAGLVFVVLGGMSTLFNFQYMNGASVPSSQGLSAQVSSTCTAEMLTTNPEGCTTNSTTNTSGSSGTSGSIDPEPDVNFAVSVSNSGILSGTVPVYITVPNASRVTLYAHNKITGQTISLGVAALAPESVSNWIFQWRTTEYDDGEYRLKALITNNFGTYDAVDSLYRIVENQTSSNTTETSGTSNTNSGDTTTSATSQSSTTTNTETGSIEANAELSVTLHPFDSVSIQGTKRVTITAVDADSVKVYLKNTTTGSSHFLGYAYEANEDTGEWRYSFNSATYPNGSYTLRAIGVFDESVIQSELMTISIQNTTTTTTSTTTTAAPTTITQPTTTTTLAPKVALTVRQSGVLSDSVDVRIDVAGANFVELYAVPQYALTQIFLGLAQKVDSSRWNFKWNTLQTPNGSYRIFAKVKNSYGLYESDRILVSVYNTPKAETETEENETPETETTPSTYEELKTLSTTIDPIIAEQKESLYITTPSVAEGSEDDEIEVASEDQEVEDRVSAEPAPRDSEKEITLEERLNTLLSDYRERIDDEIKRLVSAIRSGDERAIAKAKERLGALRDEIRRSVLDTTDEQTLIDVMDTRINELFVRIEKTTEKTEAIVKERVGEVINKDTDGDGITDYDEINLYSTDPAAADSDQDGFIDGTEILGGFDPKDSTPEAAVVYESPKEVGFVREDILIVETVTTLEKAPEETPESDTPAIIAGKALPNSFVTLYIFSTPIVVTVKTEGDGSWSYVLDKELEDGEHEVYVGMTDNTGRIIAKSAPFAFVKTAEAYAPVGTEGAAVGATTVEEPSFFSEHLILIVLSIAVVALGLVLMMLGFHMEARKKTVIDSPENQATPATGIA